jgi:hypothetical protein
VRFQSARTCLAANPCVLETCLSYRVERSAVNPLISQDFHLFSTTRGVSVQKLRELFRSTSNALPLVASRKFSARRSGRQLRNLKIAWRLCYTRKPFREFYPRMRTPEQGQIEAFCIGCQKHPRGLSRQLKTLSQCPRSRCLYQTVLVIASAESKKLLELHSGENFEGGLRREIPP